MRDKTKEPETMTREEAIQIVKGFPKLYEYSITPEEIEALKMVIEAAERSEAQLKAIIEKLEVLYGCYVGSHTSNITPKKQFKSLIKELKEPNAERQTEDVE